MAIDQPVASLFSIHSLITLGIFAVAGIVFSFTRLGRDLIALGSDRRASIMTGVSVNRLVIGSFVFSAMAAALGGTLLSMGLASASPSGLSDVLVPAVAAAILGGVSLAGGTGTPLGIAAGILTLTCCALVSMPLLLLPSPTTWQQVSFSLLWRFLTPHFCGIG